MNWKKKFEIEVGDLVRCHKSTSPDFNNVEGDYLYCVVYGITGNSLSGWHSRKREDAESRFEDGTNGEISDYEIVTKGYKNELEEEIYES